MITLPAFISDGMVVTKNAKIWGWATAAESVPIQFNGREYTATADAEGRFEATLESAEFGGAHTLTIGERVINNVTVGRVWLMGGQSNMEGPIERSRAMWEKFVKPDARIRMFHVEKNVKFDGPARDVVGNWATCSPQIPDWFHAVPYFFARALLRELNDGIPVGLLCNPAGGTPIEGWLPQEIIRDSFPLCWERLQPVLAPDFMENETAKAAAAIDAWNAELTAKDAGLAGNWHAEDTDDSAWASRMLFDSTGSPEYGSVWLRRRIILEETPQEPVRLNFGRLENSVLVYVNGQAVGQVDYMYPPCTCILPQGLLRTGENLVAVRLVGSTNAPRPVPGKDYNLVLERDRINPPFNSDFYVNLADGLWKWKTGAAMPVCPQNVWFYGYPTAVYNHLMTPVLGYGVDGICWYQGESNTGRSEEYAPLFTAFAKHMREHFGENTPIISTQLANYITPDGNTEGWAALREQQRKCLEIPNTGMAVAIDCGEYNDLHPIDKRTVGERLAKHALRLAYGRDIAADGPVATGATCNGEIVAIQFANAAGLWAKGGHPLVEFVSADGSPVLAYASIKGETIVTRAPSQSAKKVRFGWSDCPAVALYNAHNLPASPFETEVVYE